MEGKDRQEPREFTTTVVWGYKNLASQKSKKGLEKVQIVLCSQSLKGFFLGALLLNHSA